PEDTAAFAETSPAPPETTDAGLIREAVSALIDIEWPEALPEAPERTVFPLTNTFGVYQTSMAGTVTFVDAELNAVPLPFEPVAYAVVGSGYAVVPPAEFPNQPGEWVLMLGDGSLPTDENGRYYPLMNVGEDSATFDVAGHFAVTCQTSDEYEMGEMTRYGLYDMKERREILPREYTQIQPAGYQEGFGVTMLYTVKDGQWALTDYSGRVLYNMDGDRFAYELDTENRVFYRISQSAQDPYDVSYYLNRWGGYILVSLPEAPGRAAELAVADAEGRTLYRRAYEQFLERGGELYIQMGGEWVALDKDLNERAASDPGGPEEETGPVRYKDPDRYIFVGENGEIIAETDGYIWENGGFILLTERVGVMRTDPKTVYAPDGTLLLDNVYGWIDEVLAPGGGLFVYLDPETCVLLTPGGGTTPVPAAPAVEKVYQGG
ncbi:MAG: hypothetical protein LBR76_01455, partial [Oscillospiraceae bacterium]|nr:hypothetical protein [Oscillospiraceae bacterium]